MLGDHLFPAPARRRADSAHLDADSADPNLNCDQWTPQVIEFMAPHCTNGDAGFFYHHRANLKITADPNKSVFNPNGSGDGVAGGGATAGAGGSGAAGTGSSGAGGTGIGVAGTGVATGGDMSVGGVGARGVGAGAGSTGGTDTIGTTPRQASGSGGTNISTQSNSGGGCSCGIAGRTHGPACAFAALGLLFALARRRQSENKTAFGSDCRASSASSSRESPR